METASRDMEADRKNRLAKETEFGQLQRDNALLQHKLSDSQRRADLEADKRKKVNLHSFFFSYAAEFISDQFISG